MLVREFLELLDKDSGVEIWKPLYDENGVLERYEVLQIYAWDARKGIPFTVLGRRVEKIHIKAHTDSFGTPTAIPILYTMKGEAE